MKKIVTTITIETRIEEDKLLYFNDMNYEMIIDWCVRNYEGFANYISSAEKLKNVIYHLMSQSKKVTPEMLLKTVINFNKGKTGQKRGRHQTVAGFRRSMREKGFKKYPF